MAYIGNVPAEKYTALTQQTFSTPTGTSFTLSQAVTNSVDIDLYIDNVKQDPASYSVSGTALTTSTIASPSTMYCIYNGKAMQTVNPPDDSVGTAKVTDDAITLAKLAPGTDGNIISFDASGNPVAVATGTDGQVLTSTGAGSAPAFEALPAGGGWGFVSQVSSGGSPPTTMSFTNMVAGYDYLYVTGPMLPSSDSIDFWYYLGVAGPTYRTSGYLNGSGNVGSGGASAGTANTTEMMINDGNGPAVGNATDEGIQFMETILLNPAGTTDTHVHTVCSYRDNTGAYNQCNTGGLLNLAEAHTSIRFNFSGGTMTGTILQYRRSRT